MSKPQRQKTRNKPMHEAMVELRQGSRTSPHRNRARYNRNDWRRQAQSGRIDL